MKKLILILLFFVFGSINAQFNPAQFYNYGKRTTGYTVEYQAILNRATVLGYALPDDTQNTKNDNKIKYLKQIGAWSLLDLFYNCKQPVGLADFATLNWVNPSLYQLNQSNGSLKPDFIADSGFKGGSGKYFNTGFTPSIHSVNLAQGSSSGFYKTFDTPSTYTTALWTFGGRNGSNTGQILIGRNLSTSKQDRIFGDNSINRDISTLTDDLHHQINNFNLNGHLSIYDNGNIYTSTTTNNTVATKTSQPLIFLGWNNNGTITPTVYALGVSYIAFGGNLQGKELDIYKIMSETF